MEKIIQPKILKGFRDFLPQDELLRQSLVETITRVYKSFGFVPIDTPVLEYADVLLRKSNGETEKQVFRFEDAGGRDVALRFDLTVPFARYTASHKDELHFPFKRYHIAKVWRGEKPQAGRYREFMQCDIDTVGSASITCDFEILFVIVETFRALGIENFSLHVNHRALFNRFLKNENLAEKSEEILRSVDKLAKQGKDSVTNELSEITGNDECAKKILSYVETRGDFLETLSHIENLAGGKNEDSERLRSLFDLMKNFSLEKFFTLDPSITRGLDYYTGIVFETFLDDAREIGSVCSGGRYDNLAGLYMKETLPGVGASIGLDRLIAALGEKLNFEKPVLDAEIFCLNESDFASYERCAFELRALGIFAEVFPDAKKMAQQYALAESKKIRWGIFINEKNIAEKTLDLKNLQTREMHENVSVQDAKAIIRSGK